MAAGETRTGYVPIGWLVAMITPFLDAPMPEGLPDGGEEDKPATAG